MDMLIQKDWKTTDQPPLSGSLLDRVLVARGLVDERDRRLFLDQSLDRLHDPFLLAGMDIAVDRMARAIHSGEKILIHGDYDVDGLTATTLLTRLLRSLGALVSFLIPDRMADGYGISWSGVMNAVADGVTLLVTVDCGVSSASEINRLAEYGVETIITDHHECPKRLPDALVILNPRLSGSPYPFKALSGVGVAYKFAQALCSHLGCPGRERAFLDLVAIGTVADVVSLTDENRIMTAYGLADIQKGSLTGINALMATGGLNGKPVTSTTIGFSIAPKLNAAGRMGNAARALDLLLTDDPNVAVILAEELVTVNKDRQALESTIFSEAVAEIDCQQDVSSDGPIIVAKEGWHSGVIGIVAARLAEQYHRPAIVLSGEDGAFKGSGRSFGSFDLLAAIESAADFLIRYGGHRKAAGMTVSAEHLLDFRQQVARYGLENLDPEQLRPALQADLMVKPVDLTISAAFDLEKIMPYGEGNRQPAFILSDLRLAEIRPVGNGRHIRIVLQADRPGQPGLLFEGIGFGLGEADELYSVGDRVDVFFHLEINRFNGQTKLSLQVRDLRLAVPVSVPSACAARIPTMADFKIVYQYLSSQFAQRPVLTDLSILGRRIARNYQIGMDGRVLQMILHVFADAGLLKYRPFGSDRVRFQLLPTSAERIKLQEVPAYRQLLAQGGKS